MAELSGMVAHTFKYQNAGGGNRQNSVSLRAPQSTLQVPNLQSCKASRKQWDVNNRNQVWRHKAIIPAVQAVGTGVQDHSEPPARVSIYSNVLFWVYHLNNFNNSFISNVKCGLCLTLLADRTHFDNYQLSLKVCYISQTCYAQKWFEFIISEAWK